MKDYNITQETVQKLSPDTVYSSTEIYKIFDQPKLGGNSRNAFNKRLSQFVSYIYDPKDCLYYWCSAHPMGLLADGIRRNPSGQDLLLVRETA